MALGGGLWVAQNKILPGAYINFISAARATATLSDRGIATIPIINDWGAAGEVLEVSSSDFQKNSLKLFGYDFTDPKMKGLRDLFKNIRLGYIFRLGDGGTKASNTLATAKFAGERGNALKIIVAANVDESSKFDVTVLLDTTVVYKQTVASSAELSENDFVVWKSAALTLTAGTPLSGGASPMITNADHQTYIDVIEGYSFNTIGCLSGDAAVKGLYGAFTRRMRDEQGVKFQCVMFNPDANSDYEGVIDVMNSVTDNGADEWSAVYWATGVLAGTNVNQSAMNRIYTGEYAMNVAFTQSQLERAILGGKFAFHRVGNSEIRVLADINSLVNTTAEKGDDLKQNQTIRVIDQIANDIAVLFSTKYLGIIPNDADGRISLWSDIVQHHDQLQTIRAIQDFSGDNVTVEEGNTKRSVLVRDVVTVVNAMEQLYMTVSVA